MLLFSGLEMVCSKFHSQINQNKINEGDACYHVVQHHVVQLAI